MNDTSESAEGAIPAASRGEWLLFIHRLPPDPAYLRVKIRRRLRRLGAVALKQTVYALPAGDEALEDLHWLRREVLAEGGDAMICAARFLAGAGDAAGAALRRPRQDPAPGAAPGAPPRGATWVTRRDIQVDRLASAWLIRRFIDPAARFRFVAPEGYRPEPGELRFDMFEGEFTHEGERCTFETLLARFGPADAGLRALGEVVHDLDCKDAKFARPEADGVALLVRGLALAHPDDEARLAAALPLFDSLLAHFQERGA